MANSIVNDTRSPSARAEVAERARVKLEPPLPLMRDELFYWNSIIQARSVKEWQSGISLHLAYILAKAMAQLDREFSKLESEGVCLTGAQGGSVPNPRVALVQSLRGTILRYESRLQLDVEAGGDTERKAARKAEREAKSRDQMADDDGQLIQRLVTRARDDELLPRPGPKSVQ